MTRGLGHWLPPLVWMALIWGFSTDAGSAEHTFGIVAWLVNALAPWATPEQVEAAHGVIRKLGHLTEYAILAALWFRAFLTGRRLPSLASALAALAISVSWAVTDEWHQAFVPSRTPSALDVALDTTGALLAVAILHARSFDRGRGERAPLLPDTLE